MTNFLGAVGYRVGTADGLKPVLEEAFSKAKSVITDCPVSYRENLENSRGVWWVIGTHITILRNEESRKEPSSLSTHYRPSRVFALSA